MKKETKELKKKNIYFKKGTFLKCNGSIYVVIGFVENNNHEPLAYLMRVRTKNQRFNNQHKIIVHKFWFNSNGFKVLESFNVDNRDLKITEEFIDYVLNYEFVFQNTNNKWNSVWHINGNFKKFKDYSKRV